MAKSHELIPASSLLNTFEFPIKSLDEFTRLEKLLSSDLQFKHQFVKNFSALPYVIGNKKSNFKYALRVANSILGWEVLSKFSWCGNHFARVAEKRKLAFRDFSHTVRTFYEIIASKDRKYTSATNVYFFQFKLLRNSAQRLLQQHRIKRLVNYHKKLMFSYLIIV